jgi:signal transduction histidine kinase
LLLVWAYRGFNAIIIINLLLVALWLFADFLFQGKVILAIKLLYMLMGASFLLTVVALIFTYRAQRSSVLFFTLAFSMNLLAYLCVVLEEYGIIDLGNWPLSPFFIGLFFEMVIFSIALSYRSRIISDDRSRLLGSIQLLKRDAMNAFVEGVEVEKKRVASELHDDVAATLSLLKRTAERGVEPSALVAELATVTERVRQLSYNLNPVALDEESFLEQLRKLVDEHRRSGLNIVLQVFDIRTEMPKELGLELYRIVQEALQNILKYAEASQVDVQLFQHEEELLLTIEDNGKGFDPELARSGLGTRNMRSRTERLGGTFDISSAPMKGTSIMVSVPIISTG